MTRDQIISLVVLLLAVAVLGFFSFKSLNKESVAVTNFEECAAAGYPVLESYPRQCNTPDGKHFVEGVNKPVASQTTADGCYIGGCSQQICSDEPDVVSSCEYRSQYACYGSATCEKQADGRCGWTETASLKACLGNFSDIDPSLELK